MQVAMALSHACIKVVSYSPEVVFILPGTKEILERHNRHYQAAFNSVGFPKISNVVDIGMYMGNILLSNCYAGPRSLSWALLHPKYFLSTSWSSSSKNLWPILKWFIFMFSTHCGLRCDLLNEVDFMHATGRLSVSDHLYRFKYHHVI
jgi:hypothetical protein